MTFKKYFKSLIETISTAGMLALLIAGSITLGHFFTVTNISQNFAEWVGKLPLNRYIIPLFIMIIYQIGGSFIEDLAFMMLATPIFFSTVVALGFILCGSGYSWGSTR
jgi:C4-dicarboxylate transporter, DctM subunit